MIKKRIVKYEFVMNEEQFKVLMAVCDPNEFLYSYITEGNWRNGNEKTKVTMTERILDEVEVELERYIARINTAFDFEEREITREEWEFYDSVKELLEGLQDENYYEEW